MLPQGLPINTAEMGVSLVKYTIYDFYGNVASAVFRRVVVVDPCADNGEVPCYELLSCSTIGLCDANVAALDLGGLELGIDPLGRATIFTTGTVKDRVRLCFRV